MATPKKYFSKATFSRDASGEYAEKRGFLLEFTDVRNSKNYISFIAFLSSFNQTFNSNWNTEEVVGRMDPISTYKNTTRTITIAWDVPAGDIGVAKENLERCNKLLTMMYPSYVKQGAKEGNALAMSKPPLLRVKFANLICGPKGDGLLGFITSCDWSPVLEMGYHASVSQGEGEIFPKVISLSIQIQVLHEVELGYDEENKLLSGNSSSWPFKTPSNNWQPGDD